MLYLFLQLDEAERIAHLQEESREIQRAFRVNMAFANPEALRAERDRHELALARDPRVPPPRRRTQEEIYAAAMELWNYKKDVTPS